MTCKVCEQIWKELTMAGFPRLPLHEIHESKLPFISHIDFMCSKLSNFSTHVSGVIDTCVTGWAATGSHLVFFGRRRATSYCWPQCRWPAAASRTADTHHRQRRKIWSDRRAGPDTWPSTDLPGQCRGVTASETDCTLQLIHNTVAQCTYLLAMPLICL